LVRRRTYGVRATEDTSRLVSATVGDFLGGIGRSAAGLPGVPMEEQASARRGGGGRERAEKRHANGNGRWIDE
jgi:hypothetical protein